MGIPATGRGAPAAGSPSPRLGRSASLLGLLTHAPFLRKLRHPYRFPVGCVLNATKRRSEQGENTRNRARPSDPELTDAVGFVFETLLPSPESVRSYARAFFSRPVSKSTFRYLRPSSGGLPNGLHMLL